MVIYLKHPQHGTKVAISELEAAYDEKHGWQRFDPVTVGNTQESAEISDIEERRKRGRPPTNQMLRATG